MYFFRTEPNNDYSCTAADVVIASALVSAGLYSAIDRFVYQSVPSTTEFVSVDSAWLSTDIDKQIRGQRVTLPSVCWSVRKGRNPLGELVGN